MEPTTVDASVGEEVAVVTTPLDRTTIEQHGNNNTTTGRRVHIRNVELRASSVTRSLNPQDEQACCSEPTFPGGTKAPYFTASLTGQRARKVLQNHDEYVTSVDRHMALGDNRAAVSLIAFIPVAKRQALRG